MIETIDNHFDDASALQFFLHGMRVTAVEQLANWIESKWPNNKATDDTFVSSVKSVVLTVKCYILIQNFM